MLLAILLTNLAWLGACSYLSWDWTFRVWSPAVTRILATIGPWVGFDILFFDVNKMKQLNENYGYDGADAKIRTALKVIRRRYLWRFSVGRVYSGDEFMVLVPRMRNEKGQWLSEAIRIRVCEAFERDGMSVTAYCGRSLNEAKQAVERLKSAR